MEKFDIDFSFYDSQDSVNYDECVNYERSVYEAYESEDNQ